MAEAANEPGAEALQISEADLSAYAQGRLPRARRAVIEGFLAANPDLAAQVMTQMHLGGVRRPRRGREILMAAAFAVVLGACGASALMGWTAAEHRDLDGWREADGDDPPDFVEDAADSRQATRLRDEMASQVETPRLDASEIRRTLKVPLPKMPATWRVRDVQIFPTDDGPSVNLVVDTDRGRVELFAIREASTSSDKRPEIANRGREAVAFWQRGDAAYVLSGPQSPAQLLADASVLAKSANL